MTWMLLRTVLRARREGLLHLVKARAPVRLDCLAQKCAKCCKLLGAPVVTPAEAERLRPECLTGNQRGLFVRSEGTRCCLLREGLCSIYEDRPSGCREYPWYNIGGVLYYDAGCPGIQHDRDERPEIESIGSYERFFPHTCGALLWLIRWVCIRAGRA